MESTTAAAERRRVALVAGVTGIVGLTLAELLLSQRPGCPSWRLYGAARRPKPAWFPHHSAAHCTYIQCDLLDREQTLASLSPLTHVTHLFFTTWTNRGTEEANVEANASMLRNTLDALLLHPNSALQHVCLQTGTKHYLGPFDILMSRTLDSNICVSVFAEDMPRLPGPNFYYTQEDILLEAAASTRASMARALTWSVHRAPIILGCPQIWEAPLEAADSRLIAEQEIWAATNSAAHNQAFNISNGDGVKWRDIWPTVAAFFNLQAAPYTGETQTLVEILRGKAHVWEQVVSEYNLLYTGWDHLVLGWWGFDLCTRKLPPYRLSMAKSSELGFAGSYSDTKASLLTCFQNMQAMGLIPRY